MARFIAGLVAFILRVGIERVKQAKDADGFKRDVERGVEIPLVRENVPKRLEFLQFLVLFFGNDVALNEPVQHISKVPEREVGAKAQLLDFVFQVAIDLKPSHGAGINNGMFQLRHVFPRKIERSLSDLRPKSENLTLVPLPC